MDRRPVIGVTGPDASYPWGWWATKLAIETSGGIAVRLTPTNYRDHRKEHFQAIIIGGGNDIDAGLYGEENTGRSSIDPERDLFEIEMIRHALDTRLPVLGICRGAQLINVVLGGSLHPDLRPLRRRTSNRHTPWPRKLALLDESGLLHEIFKKECWRINSLHHQAVDRLGEGLRVAARDLDGFVQAVESTSHPWLVGVQWHPEYLLYLRRQHRLFRHLVDRAAAARPESLSAKTTV